MKILLIGELAHDITIYGKSHRLCPEAPVPVFLPNETKTNLGMAGNVLNNLKSLEPDLEIDTIFQTIPIKKTRYIDSDSGYLMLRVDEDDKVLEQDNFSNVGWKHKKFITEYDAVIISDYNKGFLSPKDIEILSFNSDREKVPMFLDTKKYLGKWSKNVDFIKINKKEFTDNLNFWNKNDLSYNEEIYKNLIVTLGKEGASLWQENFTHKLDEIDVKDVSGAGDTFLAALCIEYLRTLDIKKAMIYANRAARIAVSHRGIVSVKKEEIL